MAASLNRCPSLPIKPLIAVSAEVTESHGARIDERCISGATAQSAACLDDAMRSAREAFSHNQMSFTPLRENVFRKIAGSHKAVGAYEVLHSLAKKGTRLTPISVYRIINTLLDLGVIRRFKSRNAYYASRSDDPLSPRIVLAYEICGRVADADTVAVFRGIRRSLAHRAFSPRSAIIEVLGVRAHCVEPRNARP